MVGQAEDRQSHSKKVGGGSGGREGRGGGSQRSAKPSKEVPPGLKAGEQLPWFDILPSRLTGWQSLPQCYCCPAGLVAPRLGPPLS